MNSIVATIIVFVSICCLMALFITLGVVFSKKEEKDENGNPIPNEYQQKIDTLKSRIMTENEEVNDRTILRTLIGEYDYNHFIAYKQEKIRLAGKKNFYENIYPNIKEVNIIKTKYDLCGCMLITFEIIYTKDNKEITEVRKYLETSEYAKALMKFVKI